MRHFSGLLFLELYLENDQKCNHLKWRFFPFHSRGALLTFLKRLSDVLECLANTSCHQEASNLGLNYLCKLAGCTLNVQPANLHNIFFRCKARHGNFIFNQFALLISAKIEK